MSYPMHRNTNCKLRVLQVLKGKFKKMLDTGNKSEIPTELQQVTYAVVRRALLSIPC